MSNTKGTKRPASRKTRDHVESVRKNAAAVGKELDAEQSESVGELAKALGEISEGEALAHLDSRLAFIERQVERLAARKDEADRGVQGELAVMRARVEDALEAVGATAEQQREALALLEKRLAGVVSDAERGSADVVTTLRKEIVTKVHSTARRLEKLDARIRGEMAAFQEGFEERSRALAQSVTEAKVNFEDSLAESAEDLEVRVQAIDAALGEHSESLSRVNEEMQAELEASRSRIVEDLTIRLKGLEGNLNNLTEESLATVEKAEADLKAFIEEASNRAAAADASASSVSESIEEVLSEKAEQIDQRLAEHVGEIRKRLDGERAGLDAEIRQLSEASEAKIAQESEAHQQETSRHLDALRGEFSEALNSHRTKVDSDLESSRAEIVETLASNRDEVGKTLAMNRAAIDARLAGLREHIDETLAAQRADLEERISDDRRVVDENKAVERREMEARLSEWGAEVRLDSQKLREAVENRSKAMAEALDVVRKDLLTRIQASEEKTAGAAIRLQSLLDQQRREIVTDEEEWSGGLNEVGEDLSDLKIRVEQLAGRVSAAEARRAAEKGSSNASVESTAARVEALEQKVREAVEDMVAKQGTRLEMLASQVAGMSESEVAAEEQLGAVDYLKRRVGEMAERVDEIVVKVNAIGRYVTKPGPAARLKIAQAVPTDLSERLSAVEGAIQKLEAKEPDSPDVGIATRLEALERAIGQLSKAIAARPEPPPFVSAPPPQPGSAIDLSVKVEEPKKPTTATILPSKRRRW